MSGFDPGEDEANQSDDGMQTVDRLAAKMVEEMDGEKQAVQDGEKPSPRMVFAKRAAILLLSLLIVASWLYVFTYYQQMSGRRFEAPDEPAATKTVRDILAAQARFREGRHRDTNGDGVADYGELHQLADVSEKDSTPASLDAVLRSREGHGYVFTLLLRNSAPDRPPGFTLIASPLDASRKARTIMADEGGTVRFEESGGIPRAHDIAAE